MHPRGSRQYRPATGDFGYYVDDPHATAHTREPLRDRVDAVVVGGGFGGLLAAARLRQAGLDRIRVIERGGDFGGTWYWNRYPGIHCDIESYVYLPLLEEVGYVPKWRYAPGEEIRQHARAIGRHFDLYADACFGTEVDGLRWDDAAGEWTVTTDRGDRIAARYVVVSGGPFGRPKLPGIPGIENFRGHTFHTSRWDYAYTGGGPDGDLHRLADKRVGLIGTGATAIQCVPHLAAAAGHLYVFQRTPSSVAERGNRPTDPGWSATLAPGWHHERRENFLAAVSGAPVDEDLVDDGWTAGGHLLGTLMPRVDHRPQGTSDEERDRQLELADFRAMNEIRARVDRIVADPATAEALKPWYRYACKRPTFSDSYLETFNRPNTTLVDTAGPGIEQLTERAVVVDGVPHEVDCVIFATGFDLTLPTADRTGFPIHGRAGRTLAEHWAAGPRTLHGFYSHGFPNLFHLGALQNASAVNFTHVLDEQALHIAEVVAEAAKRTDHRVEPTAEAEEGWQATLRERGVDHSAFHAECTPGYYNNEGRVRAGRRPSFGDGPIAFHRLIRRWRAEGGLRDVLAD
ncbi:flavin-containing monooxygenase [Streptomyces hainanensis]|uniref:NAD(P)/FAD-dependent oxidoreductase n=1 Tax=Streptomyces hainanensis TaxID=402648 RepID=A0A4V2Y475_9ACTN|nr:NAD(P)/FAD-dependent oxidoreductase [Streptomyces hainanensis]TDC79295.1 NAD(P)/FAD-dependent oxidoreductase [Streptomyces hainanensis]